MIRLNSILVLLTLGLSAAGVALAGAPAQADLHLDTLTQLYTRNIGLDVATGLQAGTAQLTAGGTNVAVFALWPPRAADGPARVSALLARFEAEDARLSSVDLARGPEDARRIIEEGHIAAVLSMEGAHGLAADWRADLEALQRRGLSMLGLTWSFSNRFAGSSGDDGGGLTDEGRQLVAAAQGLGLLVDVSHASKATTMDVCRGATAPIIASHSSTAALTHRGRNLSDEEITCIAATGGVIGVNLHQTFLGRTGDVVAVADHMDHLRQVGGDGVVALGSDYDGYIKTPTGMPDASALPGVWAELKRRGWTDAQIAGARGENFMRAWAKARAARKAP